METPRGSKRGERSEFLKARILLQISLIEPTPRLLLEVDPPEVKEAAPTCVALSHRKLENESRSTRIIGGRGNE